MTTAQTRSEWLELGVILRDARRRCDMTQEQAAAALGLTRTTMTQLERGKQNPMLHLRELSNLYGVPMAELVSEQKTTESGLHQRLLNEDENTLLRAYRRRDLATIHRLIERWYEVNP